MSNIKIIKQQIETTQTIEAITEALGDIATMRLKKVRTSIEHNIHFFQEISKVYRIVKSIGLKDKHKSYLRKTNGKAVAILLTSNSSFYGGLDAEVTRFFVQNTINLNCDRVVVGNSGKDLILSLYYPHKFNQFIFKSDSPKYSEVKILSETVFQYSKILVFHTKFVTVLNQMPTISDISEFEKTPESKTEKFFYLLEPEIGKMLTFFENQIALLLFESIFAEVDLARTAARMISMNQAEDNAQKVLTQEKRALSHFKKQLINTQAIETYANLHQIRF